MQRTILVVEDDRLCAGFLETVLHSFSGCDVRVVFTVADAMQRLEEGPVDLLVTDLHLPAQDGFQLIEVVRSKTQFANLPIIVISGDGRQGTAAQVHTLGANTYLSKPYSPAVLRNKVKELMNEA